MDPLMLVIVVIVGILSAALGASFALLYANRSHAQKHAQQVERAVALERDLAIERERTSRTSQLEAAVHQAQNDLAQERTTSARLQVDLASATADKLHLEQTRGDLSQRLQTATSDAQALRDLAERSKSELEIQLNAARLELATLNETLSQERQQFTEKLQILNDAKTAMTHEFQALAGEVLTKHGETFSKQNKEQLDLIVGPLKEKLVEFQQGLQNAHTDSVRERATLAQQIRQLSEDSAKMTSETANLTRALKGEAQTQGAWGEMILATLLEKSGLREGEEYFSQSSHATEDGDRLRPDVIVKLPGSQQIIIDSKVSMTAFESYVNCSSDEEREAHLDAHLASLRGHIKSLTSKPYQNIAGSNLDYVIMFVPIEGALALALQKDPNLTSHAVQNNVAIATPTTLMIALRTVDNVWKVERRNRNAEAIAAKAGTLYDKFVTFLATMNDLGVRLNQAQTAYQDAITRLQTGRGNLVKQVEQLREMGAKTTKAIPEANLERELEETADQTLLPSQ